MTPRYPVPCVGSRVDLIMAPDIADFWSVHMTTDDDTARFVIVVEEVPRLLLHVLTYAESLPNVIVRAPSVAQSSDPDALFLNARATSVEVTFNGVPLGKWFHESRERHAIAEGERVLAHLVAGYVVRAIEGERPLMVDIQFVETEVEE